ncbi:hypothetical protein CSC17_4268 [Klebsiella oxytoca]|nr:hypothetical protein CSC17_4268 [Klebsiella oxytoca]
MKFVCVRFFRHFLRNNWCGKIHLYGECISDRDPKCNNPLLMCVFLVQQPVSGDQPENCGAEAIIFSI